MSRVALIAGAGRLPAEIAAVLDAPVVCAPAGVTPDGVAVEVVFHFERLVPFLRALGARGVDRVVLAGAVHRPRLDPALFDRDTAALVPDLLAAMQGGDDAALRFLIALIESFDLSVLGIADLAPQLLAGEGALTSRAPTAQELRDAERGRAVLAALAPADVGQGCAVVEGLCLGIEVLFGTDALLDDIARHRALREPRLGGVFIKRSKDRQDLRADLPTIGPATVSAVRAAGLTGIAVQAGHVLVLERAQTLALADEAGVAIWGGAVKLFVIAGEPSGDALGALMAGLRTLAPGIAFVGVGGPLMEAEGLRSLFPMAELSVMGLAEVLPKYRQLKRRIRETANAIAHEAPDAVVTIDSPDFCLRVLALARAANPRLRTIHYVAPSVWAWRPGRAAKMARVVDHVLALLPFEPPYMTQAGMSCDFVGHPVVAQPQASADEATIFRAGAQVREGTPLILCLPGSRRGEVSRLLPVFRDALERVVAGHRGARIVIPTTPNVTALVRSMTAGWRGVIVLDPTLAPPAAYARQKRAAFRAADVALAASGTVSLELAAAGTPMVIAYRMNAISQAIIARLLRVDSVTLVNLVSETRAVPEFIGPDCRAEAIAPAIETLLGAGRAAQLAAMEATMDRLGRGGEAPGLRAARSVLSAVTRGRA